MFVNKFSLVVQTVMSLHAMWETQVQSLGRKDPLEMEMATHSSILAWKIAWMEKPGGLQSMRSQRVGDDGTTNTSIFLDVLRLGGWLPGEPVEIRWWELSVIFPPQTLRKREGLEFESVTTGQLFHQSFLCNESSIKVKAEGNHRLVNTWRFWESNDLELGQGEVGWFHSPYLHCASLL